MATKKPLPKKSVVQKTKSAKSISLKASAKKTTPLKKPTKTSTKKVALNIKKPLTKSQIVEHLSTTTGVKKKEVTHLLENIVDLIQVHLNKKGPGEMNFAGIFKCRVVHKPATKARQGVNPFTGSPMTFSAKPARSVIKIRPLKKLNAAVL